MKIKQKIVFKKSFSKQISIFIDGVLKYIFCPIKKQLNEILYLAEEGYTEYIDVTNSSDFTKRIANIAKLKV